MKGEVKLFSRQQVWELPNTRHSELCLIVSVDESNSRNRVVNVVKIHQKKSQHYYPMQVQLKYNHNNYAIDCDQICTYNPTSFAEGTYKFMLPDDKMNEVVEKLSLQLGITEYIPGYEGMMRIVDTLSRKYIEEMKSKLFVTENQANEICKKALDIISGEIDGITATSPIKPVITEVKVSKTKQSVKPTTKKKKRKHKPKKLTENWDEDMKLEFLGDCEKYSLSNVGQKYNMSPTSVFRFREKFAEELGIDVPHRNKKPDLIVPKLEV